MAKSNQEKAKELAQTFGRKVKRSDIKAAEEAGYSADDIRAAADRVGKVGDKATAYMDANGGDSSSSGPKKVQYANLPGTQGQRVVLDKDGRYLANGSSIGYLENTDKGRGILYSGKYRVTKNGSADKINKYLEDNNYRLTPGKNPQNWGIVDTKPITVTREYTDLPWMGMSGSGASAGATHFLPQGKEYINIYGKINRGGKKQQDEPAPQSTAAAAPTSSAVTEEILDRGRRGRNAIYGYTRGGRSPAFNEGGNAGGSSNSSGSSDENAIDQVLDYANRLDLYNQKQIGALYDISQSERYKMGTMMNRFIGGAPLAPQLDTEEDLINTINRTLNEIKFE